MKTFQVEIKAQTEDKKYVLIKNMKGIQSEKEEKDKLQKVEQTKLKKEKEYNFEKGANIEIKNKLRLGEKTLLEEGEKNKQKSPKRFSFETKVKNLLEKKVAIKHLSTNRKSSIRNKNTNLNIRNNKKVIIYILFLFYIGLSFETFLLLFILNFLWWKIKKQKLVNLNESKINITINNNKDIEYNNKIINDNLFIYNIKSIIYQMIVIISFNQIIFSKNELNSIESKFSSITLKINGIWEKNVFSSETEYFFIQYYPHMVYINGEKQNTVNYSYYFNQTDNFVELIWNNSIDYCRAMFYRCWDITKINVSNFDTSKVTIMRSMFNYCIKLTSLDLSNFDTKNVVDMADMFYNCQSLSSIDLSNFDTSKVTQMDLMFAGSTKLEYINLKYFTENESLSVTDFFLYVPDNIVICLNENNAIILSELNKINCYVIDCSDNWQIKQKKKVNKIGICIDNSDNDIIYNYEYNGTYYEYCLNGNLINNSTIKSCYYDNKTIDENNFCGISDFFKETRTCKINLETADEDIVQFLTSELFIQLLYNNTIDLNNKSLIMQEDNEIFSISLSRKERNTIDLGECEIELRRFYHIIESEDLIIYKHEILFDYFLIPIIGFQVFYNYSNNLYSPLNFEYCTINIIEYKIPVNKIEDNLDIYNPLSNYYNDNCSYVSDKSLYDRKKEFNYNNLSICQKECEFNSYDSEKKIVTCFCPVISPLMIKNEELLYKFDLKDSDKNKCMNESKICSFEDIFNIDDEEIICKINASKIHQEIMEGLKSQSFRENFIDKIPENQNKISVNKDNYIFSLSISQYEETIHLGECEEILKNVYHIRMNESLYIYKHEYLDNMKQIPIIEYEVFNKNFSFDKNYCEDTKIEIDLPTQKEQNFSLDYFMNMIMTNISAYIDPSFLIQGDDFNALILSSDDMDVEDQLKNGISAVDLGNCTEVIKEYYNISNEENLIVLNIESHQNKTKDYENSDSFNLGKNVRLEVYDNSGRQLNLSVCKENIKVLMNLEGVEELDVETSKKYSEQGIDVFNARDNFFNDLCHKYDNIDGIDIIIDDRRSDIYQNVTFCQDGCHYDGVDYNLMAARCLCYLSVLQNNEKNVTNDDKEEKEVLNFKTITKSFISNLLDFNIEVIYCYNLIFDKKILLKNIGFYSMIVLNFLQIIFLCIFLIKKLRPIKKYMLKNPLGKKTENAYPPKKSHSKRNKKNDKDTYIENDSSKINNKENKKRTNSMNKDLSSLQSHSQSKLFSKDNINNKILIQQDNCENMDDILNIGNNKCKQKKSILNIKKEKDKIKEIISDSKNSNEIIIKIKDKNKSHKKRKRKSKIGKINNIETIGEKENEKNKDKKIDEAKTEDDLDEMDYEEAIIYDKRSYIKMYLSSLVDSQIILDTFFSDNHLNLFIVKISFFISIFEVSFFLNALFYSDEYISDAYHNNGVLDFVSGLPKAIYSFLATLILTNLLKMLSNSKSELMKLMKENSKDKDYSKLIKAKLKKLKIKLIIYFILIFILGLLFLYYVSAFCAVYRYSQKYWFYGFLESFGMDFLTAFVTTSFLTLLKFIAIRKKIKFLFILSNIIGTFL